jgi:formylglycine-generating enzyme required for sulfatase activity
MPLPWPSAGLQPALGVVETQSRLQTGAPDATPATKGVPGSALPWHRVWLGSEALLEMSLAKVTHFDEGPDLVKRIRGWLQQLLAQEALSPFERMQAGMTLGQLGDARPGVGTRPRAGKKDQPDLLWTGVIQPGEFIMGGKTPYQENPQFKHRLQHPFCLAVHPVTVAQFELFVQDGGYGREELWTKAGWEWRASQQRTRPNDYESVFQTPNHPRVGVTWYEAVAFCHWLNAAFTPAELKLPDKEWEVRLPSEAEWERAARHTDGRKFPWKDKAEPASRCNCHETQLRQTSAVAMFPSAKAECGALDLAGNVWEWTLSAYEEYPYDPKDGREDLAGARARVLRGGSWSSEAAYSRCAYRGGLGPDDRYWSFGFRVVASPFFALNSESSEL